MPKPTYAAGIQFIVSKSDLSLTPQDRKKIRSHTTKAQGKSRKTVPLQSWIDPGRSLGVAEKKELQKTSYQPVTICKSVGGSFAGLDLAPGIEPTTIEDLVKLIDFDREGVYPYDVCLQVHPVERGWFPYMVSDICCIHSLMFSVRTYMNGALPEHQLNRQANFHYAQTLQILQTRIIAFQQGQSDLVFHDSTIMAVIFLAATAEFLGDFVAVKAHVDGLLKIVSLKGGIRSLTASNNMQIKVCRADLGIALRLGTQTRLFRDDITWDCIIADRGTIRCSHEPYATDIHVFMNSLDSKLKNCWKDLHTFSCMSNLAYQTTRKLSPETYSEIMISIMYRLMHLSFEEDLLQETIRVGLLTFSSTIFLTSLHMEQPYKRLYKIFDDRLFELYHSPKNTVPQHLMLWLLMLYHVVAYQQPSSENRHSVYLKETMSRSKITTWSQAKEILRSVMWVGFVHDARGRVVFEKTMQDLLHKEVAVR